MMLNVGPARTRLACAAAAVAVLGGLAAVLPGRSQAVAATAADVPALQARAKTVAPRLDWTESLAYRSPITQVAAVSCPTTSTCLVAADEMHRSTDGGHTWTAVLTPGVGYLSAVECPTVDHCVALNGWGQPIVSDDAGVSWSSTPAGGSFARLSCPSRSTCYAASYPNTSAAVAVSVSHDGGVRWTQLTIPSTTAALSAFTCPSELSCQGVGEGIGLRTDDGGAHWTLNDPRLGNGHFISLACPNTAECIGLNVYGSPNIWHSGDGGATWQSGWLSLNGLTSDEHAVDCPSATRCVMVGITPAVGGGVGQADVVDLTSGAVTHASVPAGVNGLDVVRCRAMHCVAFGRDLAAFGAGGYRAMVSDDGGVTFSAAEVPASSSVSALACANANHCVGVGRNGVVGPTGIDGGHAVRTDDDGATWAVGQMPSTIGPLNSITCPSAAECLAAGTSTQSLADPVLARTADGGSSWTVQVLPITAGRLTEPTCASEMVCLIGADVMNASSGQQEGRILRSIDGGATWSVNASWAPAGGPQIGSIGCMKAARCLAVSANQFGGGATIWASVDAGITWTTTSPPPAGSPLFVTCRTSTCLVRTYDSSHGEEMYSTDAVGGAWTRVPGGVYTAGLFCGVTGQSGLRRVVRVVPGERGRVGGVFPLHGDRG